MAKILNPDTVCEDCQSKWTSDGVWVMDTYRCADQQEFCLNCCGCPDHAGEPWFTASTTMPMLEKALKLVQQAIKDEQSFEDGANWIVFDACADMVKKYEIEYKEEIK